MTSPIGWGILSVGSGIGQGASDARVPTSRPIGDFPAHLGGPSLGLGPGGTLPLIYKETQAERRRLHGEAPWQLTGVVVNGVWHPAAKGISPPSIRGMEAGLVELAPLPAFLAADDYASAVEVALMEAERLYGSAASSWPQDVSVRLG